MKTAIYQLIKFGNGEYGIKKIETFSYIFKENIIKESYLNFAEYMCKSWSIGKLWVEDREDGAFWKCQESYKNALKVYNDICSANDEVLIFSSQLFT